MVPLYTEEGGIGNHAVRELERWPATMRVVLAFRFNLIQRGRTLPTFVVQSCRRMPNHDRLIPSDARSS